jgi:pimeloyl-ACP methyl ester carboxylesterase
MDGGKTYVLVHGAWNGGWIWRPVAERLRARGHRVLAPTNTGLAERRHLLSRQITLETFVDDVALLLEAEELADVVLVGHSFGGNTISGVADRMPGRIRHLVYLDAMVLEGGVSPFDALPPEVVAQRRAAILERGAGVALPPPPPDGFDVPPGPALDWFYPRLTPHPAGTYESPLRLRNPPGNGLARSYVACTDPPNAPLAFSRRWVRGRDGWGWAELATSHNAMVREPELVARLLEEIG